MGIIVNKQSQDNDLSKRIEADLRLKMEQSEKSGEYPDFAENNNYLKDFKKSNRFSWVWAVLIILTIVSLIFICCF